jgi:hypothetical protein
MRKYLFLYLFLTIISFHSFSQNVTIRGYVHDSMFKVPLQNATVKLFIDSIFIKQTITNESGFFKLDDLNREGSESLIISVIGYSDKLFHFPRNSPNKIIDCDTISLSAKIFQMNAVEISAFNQPIYYNHDTLTYVADSFKVKQNATVEDLLKKLPGIKVNNQGNITSQGAPINKVLVDGDDFFTNDVTTATRNIPANKIESVQVYEKKDDLDLKKQGESSKIINLKLNEDGKQGTFGKLSGASDFKKFYEGTAFGNKFSGSEKAAVLVGGGNTPNSNENELYKNVSRGNQDNDEFSGNDLDNISDWNPLENDQQKEGISKIFNSGIYYSNKLFTKDKIRFNYTYTNNPLNISRSETSQFILKDTNYTTNNEYNNFHKLENHNVNFKINHRFNPLTELEIEPTFTLIKKNNIDLQETQYLTPNTTLSNKTTTGNLNNSTNNILNGNFTLKRKFYKSGRLMRINYNTIINNTKSDGILKSSHLYNNVSVDSLNQQKVNTSKLQTNNISIFYREPVSKSTYLDFYYNYKSNLGTQNKRTYNYFNGEYSLNDSLLSNAFKNIKKINDLGTNFTFDKSRNLLSIGCRYRHFSNKNINIITQDLINQTADIILPYIDYRYRLKENSHLNFNYTTSSDQPTITSLQPVNNNTNPNQIIAGNPDLSPTYNNTFSLSFDKFNEGKGNSLWSSIKLSKINNDFATYTVYDSLGRSIEKIINTNGNYNANFSINGLKPLFSRKVELSPSFNTDYSKTIDYINNQKNILERFGMNSGINIAITLDTIVFNFGGSINYNVPKSTLNSAINRPYFTQKYFASFQLPLPQKFILESSIDYTINNRRANGFNISYIIWNATLSKIFGKKESLVLSIIGNDILDQNINTSRTINNNIITDVKTNVIRRYFLIKLSYKLNQITK